MSGTSRPTGHLQVKTNRSGGTRSYWALWRDQHGARGGRRLGPAHVRDSGRRTPRGAIIWRAGDGPRPTPEHLTPKDAQARLNDILDDIAAQAAATAGPGELGTLFQSTQGWVAERTRDKGLKRTTLAGYEILFERLYRDLGANTPVRDFADGRLRDYFEDFKRPRSSQRADGDSSSCRRKGRRAARGRTLDRSAGGWQHPGGGGHQG